MSQIISAKLLSTQWRSQRGGQLGICPPLGGPASMGSAAGGGRGGGGRPPDFGETYFNTFPPDFGGFCKHTLEFY